MVKLHWFGVVAFLLVLAVAAPSVLAEDVSNCGVLNHPDTTYYLTSDITVNGQTCFSIIGTNITFDGQNHTLTGDYSIDTTAFSIDDGSQVSVYNLVVDHFYLGADLYSSSEVHLHSLVFFDNRNAISLFGIANSTIADISVFTLSPSDFSSGIQLRDSTGNTFDNVEISNLTAVGLPYSFSLDRSPNNNFSNITFYSSKGVEMVGSDSNVFEQVKIIDAQDFALRVLSSSNNVFNHFDVNGSLGQGVFVQLSENNSFVGLDIRNSYYSAFYLDNTNNTVITGLHIEGTQSGFDVMSLGSLDSVFKDVNADGYLITNSTFGFTGDAGRASFVDYVNANGTDFRNIFSLSSNSLVFRGDQALDNLLVNIVLVGLPTGRTNYRIQRDGADCDSSLCVPLGPLDGERVEFSTRALGSYSIASDVVQSSNTGSGGGGGGGGGRTTIARSANNTITSLSNTNSTPSTNNTVDGDVALTGNAAGQGFGKKSLWVILGFIIVIAIAFVFVQKMRARSGNSAPHLK